MGRKNLGDDKNLRKSLYVTIYIEVLVVILYAFQLSSNSDYGR